MTRFFDTLLPRRTHAQSVATQRLRRAGAFTLVEMLTVVGIIGLLAAGIGIALSGSGGSVAAMSNAQRMVSSMFQAARTNAVMKGQETAVIIYKSGADTDPNKYLRFIGIVYNAATTDGAPADWKPLNRGSYLPKGIYFSPSDGVFTGGKSAPAVSSNASIAFPIQAGAPDTWYVYSFDKYGNLSGGSTYLIFAPAEIDGPPDEESGIPSLYEPSKILPEQMGGIALLRSGGAFMLDQLNASVIQTLSGEEGDD